MTEKKESYATITPYLLVPGVSGLIEFLKQAFGAKELLRLDGSNGRLMHAEIKIGDSILMMGEPPEGMDAMPSSIYLSVEDCDSIYERAIEAGGTSVMEPMDMPHAGERYGGVRDASGNIWWIATHIEDLSEEEQKRRIAEGMFPSPDFSK